MMSLDEFQISIGDTVWFSYKTNPTSIHCGIYRKHWSATTLNIFKHKVNAINFAKNHDCKTMA